jgi:hypothetical protein
MELHHHSNLAHGFKGWKSFLWEFLMLFLAVFAASLAEYQLEHKIERDREKQYIQSLVIDLAADTTNLSKAIRHFSEQELKLDTTLTRFRQLSVSFDDTLLNSLLNSTVYVSFINTDRTMQQLKNSGAMRLINKQSAADAIMDYDANIKRLVNVSLPILHDMVLHDLLPLIRQIINLQDLIYDFKTKSIEQLRKENKTYLLQKDKVKLGELYNAFFYLKGVCANTKGEEIKLKKQAAELIKLLKKEYHLD